MLKAPKFWYLKRDSLQSNVLYPFSLIFRLGTKIRNFVSKEKKTNLPIICVGNIVIGGAGKTPVALKIGNMLREGGYNPHFVSKGYGGLEKNNTLVQDWHSPKSVGDESLLLSEIAPTWIGFDRSKSFELASENGADCIVMDDGFQNPTLQKDFSIVVINGEQGFGNKRVIPSGPLRESINRGLSRTNLVITIGDISDTIKDKIPKHIPLIGANFKIKEDDIMLKGQRITAFAGIAYPEKFFNSLKLVKANIVDKISYSDHHIYSENDLLYLAEIANKNKSILVTTKKDMVRIPKNFRSLVKTIDGFIQLNDEKLLLEILTNLIENKINQ
jgi:tetraacyldisaccharide 4'-kinase